ncbi:hypothetical protein [Clostridium disporicum]|uniref:Uncharacterized protein n=1 Tax=Clostridium disporicum TaxID=84024 RepID=A0A174L9U4_9CLOT|nr:hypothetical protein [Clostridium disporicum]CUP18525.1 Uncharacterised protein [Clostridium disporicum]
MDKELVDIISDLKNELRVITERINSIERVVLADKKNMTEDQCINKSVEDTGDVGKFFDEVYKNINDHIKYKTWIETNVKTTIIKEDTIIIRCVNSFNYDILKKRYYDLLRKSTKYKVVIEEVK